jgi:anti-sigma B factor antagonist
MKLSIQSEEANVTLVGVSGEVSQKSLAQHDDPLVEVLGDDCYQGTVLLDLRSVKNLDSSGVGWLLSCHRQSRTQGGMLVIHSVSPFARDVLKMLNMHLVFKIADDETAARKIAQGDK